MPVLNLNAESLKKERQSLGLTEHATGLSQEMLHLNFLDPV